MSAVVIYVGAALVTLALMPLLIRFAIARGVVDVPDARKVHRHPVPRIGGTAIFAGVFVTAVPAIVLNAAGAHDGTLPAVATLLAVSAGVFILGLIDDVRGVRPLIKFLALVGAATVLCRAGLRIEWVRMGPLFSLELGVWSWPVTILWIVGVTVAMNFIDGLDGLAAGIAAVTASVILVIAVHTGQNALTIVMLALLGSLTSFLYFNFHPAQTFMGDSGSMLLGFLLAAASVAATAKAPTVGWQLPALALGVPILDTVCTILRRGIIRRRSIFASERGHVHHRMMDLGISHRRTVLILHAVTLLCGLMAVTLLFSQQKSAVFLLSTLSLLALFAFFHWVGSLRPLQILLALRQNYRTRQILNLFAAKAHHYQLGLERETTVEGWWDQMCLAAEGMQLAELSLSVVTPGDERSTFSWRSESARPETSRQMIVRLPLRRRGDETAVFARIALDCGYSAVEAATRTALFARLLDECGLPEATHLTAMDSQGTAAACSRAEPHGREPSRAALCSPGASATSNIVTW